MYVNYGDRDFFERGILVDGEHSDTEFRMLLCRPYDDEKDLFRFAEVLVDIEDGWIDRAAVMGSIGMAKEGFDPIRFAIACTEYYPWEEFGADGYGAFYDWKRMDRASICRILRNRLIASDRLDICW